MNCAVAVSAALGLLVTKRSLNLKVGVLRLGDINFATVNGEVYSEFHLLERGL